MSDEKLFCDRPARMSPCCRCKGTGQVDDGYCLAPTKDTITGAPRGSIPAFVCGAVTIFEATREASELAKAAKRPVVFRFNELTVIVQPDSDPDLVARSWWMDSLGETPEQTAARR